MERVTKRFVLGRLPKLPRWDDAHVKAMEEIQRLMQKPSAMAEWFERKKEEFDAMRDDLRT